MKKLALILLLFSFGNLTAQNNLSVKEFMKYYVKVFNEENLIEYIKCLHLPRSIISNGKIIYKTEESTFEMIFGNVKKAGWAYSKINKLTVIFEDKNTAVVVCDYSRFDKNDKQYFRTEGVYSLSKENGYWKIISMTTKSPILYPQ